MRLLTRARAAGILAAVAVLAAGCSGDDDKAAFEQEVVSARDTADSSFAYIKRPESTEDLVRRLRTSGDRLQRGRDGHHRRGRGRQHHGRLG